VGSPSFHAFESLSFQLALVCRSETPHLHWLWETPSFFPYVSCVAGSSVLLVGRSSCLLGLPLGAPLANLPCVASGNPKFSLHSGNPKVFSHCTRVAGSFGFVGWVLLLPTWLAFGCSSCQHGLPLGDPLVNFMQLYATLCNL
jgi:hypothetical protein